MKRLQILSVLIHGLVLAVGWPLAWYIRKSLDAVIGIPINPLDSYLVAWPAVVALGLIVGAVFGLFSPPIDDGTFGATRRLLKTLFMNTLVVAALGFAVKEFDFGRMVVVVNTFTLLILFTVSNMLLRRYRIRLKDAGMLETPVLIVGSGEHALRALQRLEDAAGGYNVVGYVSDEVDTALPRPHLGSLSELPGLARSHSVHEIMVAIPTLETDEIMDILLQLEELPVTVHVVSTVFGVLASNEDVSFLGDNPVFTLQSAAGDRPLYDVAKRCMDCTLAFVGCLLVLPLFPLLAMAIKLDSSGPAVFYQDRVGRHGENFRMYKFRTMRTESDPYAVAPKNSGDPRITKVGAFLRKTSLDELPQLWNVLNGSMSLVGPRPEMPFIVETYEPWQRRRLDVLPGITGLWQIVGRKDLPLHENLEYDFYYIRNRSLWLDIAILLKTIPAAVFQKGAY